MRPEDIEIGTSGWKFDDWAGTFYPLRVPQTRWLEYYSARFPVGELNSTYYRIAPASVYATISKRTPPKFRLFAKVHADVTHKREAPEPSLANLLTALEPLREDGKLLGLLAQFPGNFHYAAESLEYLKRLKGMCGRNRLCVEFRHRSWANDDALCEVTESGITWVCPDEPSLPDLMPRRFICASDILYVRLHGQNLATWYNREAGDRYDYEYSEEELTALGTQLLATNASAKRGYVLFNNCHLGRAPRNAWWLQNWFSGMGSSAEEGQPPDGSNLSEN